MNIILSEIDIRYCTLKIKIIKLKYFTGKTEYISFLKRKRLLT